uniref:DOD-type homing endonuclease domain-containing protein n=1 Tax=viral metagenome TaxID=1070528 RepID=A0A6C0E0Y2_9ZZZZ
MSIKYLGFNVPVLLSDGNIKLSQDLKKDDLLLDKSSKITKINNIEFIEDDMFKIITKYNSNFIIGSEHVLNTISNINDYIYSNKIKDYNINNLNSIIKTDINFNFQKIKIDPYFLGIWIGLSCKNFKFYSDKLNVKIYNYIIHMLCRLNIEFSITSNSLEIFDERFKKYFKFYNLEEKRHIPNEYKNNKAEYRIKLLAGILDSKSNNISNSFYEIIDSNDIIKDINFIAQSLGFYTILYHKKMLIFGNDLSCIPMLNDNKIINETNISTTLFGFKIAPLFDKKCIKINTDSKDIVLGDFTVV